MDTVVVATSPVKLIHKELVQKKFNINLPSKANQFSKLMELPLNL